MHAGSLRSCPILRHCGLWPVRLLCQEGFFRQEYWGVLDNAGCHALLEHCISCCPSRQPPSTWCCQNPCDPSSCTTSTPGPHRGRPTSSRAASGANPSGRPTCRGGKPQVKPRGSVAEEEDPEPAHRCTSCRVTHWTHQADSVSVEQMSGH